MKPRSIAWCSAGLALLSLAAALVPLPRLLPRPDLPELDPFSPRDRVALVLPSPEDASLSAPLLSRARAAGAEIQIFAPGDDLASFAPTRILRPGPLPNTPAGYHPDQWPSLPPGEPSPGNDGRLLVLTPEEQAARNHAVLAAARALRASGADDPAGSREAALLSRARRAELYRTQ